MKKYFSKWLPVEGEIQNGDIVKDRDGFIWQLSEKDQVIAHTCKKVKLFLCSRDIQEGDKVYDNEHDDGIARLYIRNLTNALTYDEPTVSGNSKDGLYKVIGEISPDATWVKEGNEFDEDDIIGYIEEDEGQYLLEDIAEEMVVSPDSIDYYKIKCSQCKHFH